MNVELVILCAGVLFFSAVTIFVVFMKPDDGQLYTLFAGILGGFNGALLMILQGKKKTEGGKMPDDPQQPPADTTSGNDQTPPKKPPDEDNEQPIVNP